MPENLLAAVDEDLREGRVAEAAVKLREHLKRQPGDAAAIERLGFATHRLGDLPAAATAFGALCRLRPESAAAENNLGTVLGQMGRHVEALGHFSHAIELDASFVDARFNRAQLLELRGQSKAAIDDLRNLLRLAPTHKQGWYRLGHLLNITGRRQEAQAAFDRAIELDPEYVEARWARTMSTLPQAYDVGEEPNAFYAEFEQRLDALDRWFAEGRDDQGQRAVLRRQSLRLPGRARMRRHGGTDGTGRCT